MELSLSAGYFNSAKQPFLFNAAGVYTTPAAQTPTITFKIKLCTISGCGSGTVVTLVSIVTTATLASITNNNWHIDVMGYTAATGATGNLEIHGPVAVDLGALTTTADSIFVDTNTGVSSNIDLTAALFVDFTATFSTNAVGANSITQRAGGVMPFAATAAPVTSVFTQTGAVGNLTGDVTTTNTTATTIANLAVTNAKIANSTIDLTAKVTGLLPLANGGTNCAAPFVILPKTATYQVLAADFTCLKTITVASGTFTITLVDTATQPVAGTWLRIINYGSGVVTIARSGQNLNGGTSSLVLESASATVPSEAFVESDGTNYFASSGFANPMTTAGDIFYGGTTGLPTRLAIGGANTVIHGGASAPAYSAVVSADLNITTTTCTYPSVLTAIGATGLGTCTVPTMPQNSQSAAYTTVLGDAGKHIYHPGADTTARTFTIDSNANVAYPVGTCISFINDTSAGVVTVAITSDTMILAGPGTTGSRTLAASGIATACKMTSTRWIINGTGLT
jgi:hypothetical protein